MTLRSNYVMLTNELNLASILPILFAERLLSQDEYTVMQEMSNGSACVSERDRRDKVLSILPRKGKHYYTLFCKCVVWSGQIELAERMGVDVSIVENINKYGEYPNIGMSMDRATTCQQQSVTVGNTRTFNQPQTMATTTIQYSPVTTPIQYSPATTPIQYSPATTPIQFNQPIQYTLPVTTATTPSQYNPLSYNSPVTTPIINYPSVTDNILVLYCKDELLSTDFNPDNRRSSEQYCQEVSDLVETFTSLSNKYDQNGHVYQAYSFSYDKLAVDGNYINNLLAWSDEAISKCSSILLLCSPQLVSILNHTGGGMIIDMEHGKFLKDSLINVLAHKPVIPVFLNMQRRSDWIPLSLQHASSYVVDIKTIQQECIGVTNTEEWRGKVEYLLKEDRRLDGFVDLWKVLLKDSPPDGVPLPPIQPPPTENISRLQLMELAVDVQYIWQTLAIRLGVPISVQQSIQQKNIDCTQKTIMMFDEWTKYKREKANKQNLIDGLRACKYNAIADRVERSFI